MNHYDIIGFTAAFCTTTAFLPQVIKVIINKRTKDISLTMYILFLIGVSCWLTYGILKNDIPIIVANVITIIQNIIIIIMKLKYK